MCRYAHGQVKRRFKETTQRKPTSVETMWIGALSGGFAAAVTNPFDVITTRLMVQVRSDTILCFVVAALGSYELNHVCAFNALSGLVCDTTLTTLDRWRLPSFKRRARTSALVLDLLAACERRGERVRSASGVAPFPVCAT